MLIWLLVGLILGTPIIIAASTWRYPIFGGEPVTAAFILIAISFILITALSLKVPDKIKEALGSGLLGTLVGNAVFWGFLWSHPH